VTGGTKTASQQKPTTSYAEAADLISKVAVPTKKSADNVLFTIEQLLALFPSNNGPPPLFYQNAKALVTNGYDYFDSECWH
jgi:hypothetical protein